MISISFTVLVDHALRYARYNGQFVEVKQRELSLGHRFRLFFTIGRSQRRPHAWTGLAASPVIKADHGLHSNCSRSHNAQTVDSRTVESERLMLKSGCKTPVALVER